MTNKYESDRLQMQAEVLRGVAKALDDLSAALDGDTSFPSSSAPDAADTSCSKSEPSTSSAAHQRRNRSALNDD